MTDELRGSASPPTQAPRGRRFKRQEVAIADGGKLVLRADGSIVHVDGSGSRTHHWTHDDPEWPDHAIRFGLHAQALTVAPHGRVAGTRPPRR
jgi:hypothetical protein